MPLRGVLSNTLRGVLSNTLRGVLSYPECVLSTLKDPAFLPAEVGVLDDLLVDGVGDVPGCAVSQTLLDQASHVLQEVLAYVIYVFLMRAIAGRINAPCNDKSSAPLVIESCSP